MTYRRAYIGVVVVQGHVAAAGRRQLAGAMRLLDQHGGLAALDLLVVLAGHVRRRAPPRGAARWCRASSSPILLLCKGQWSPRELLATSSIGGAYSQGGIYS